MRGSPFDSIESAQEYVSLLGHEVETAAAEIQEDIAEAVRDRAARRLDALRLVDFKLQELARHLGTSRRILNDLRMLRRLLLEAEAPRTAPRTEAPGKSEEAPDDSLLFS